MSADLVARLIEAGTPAALVAEVAMALGRAERLIEAELDRELAVERRAQHVRDLAAERQRKHRSEKSSRVSRVMRVTERDTRDADPSLDKRNPQTPKKINPTPHEGDAGARETDRVPAHLRLAAAQIVIAVVIGGLSRRRWRDMPPPPGVADDQWAGFIAHRKAKRETLTLRAYTLLLGKLERHADDDWPPGRIVDTIVDRGWTSFEKAWLNRISEQENGRSRQNGRPPRGDDAGDAIFAARRRLGIDG
jgi:hypothetical protein